MNKKILALVTVIIVLVLIIGTMSFLLYQSTNNNETQKADSFELQIKDLIGAYTSPANVNAPNFSVNDNATAMAQFKATYSGNLTAVSETTFLADLNNCMPTYALTNGLYKSSSIIRTGNTFYLVTLNDNYNVAVPQFTSTCVSYTP